MFTPKTRRTHTRQHVAIGQSGLVALLDALFGSAPPDRLLCGLSSASFRLRWDAVFAAFGLGASGPVATPGSLRGYGATALYRATGNIALVQWRGRWARQRSVERYVQESASASALLRVPASARDRI